MLNWLWKIGKVAYAAIKTVAVWSYTKPMIATAVGLATYTTVQALRAKAEEIGYVPVVTEIGYVFGFLASTFMYAVATGLAASAVVGLLKSGVDPVRKGFRSGLWYVEMLGGPWSRINKFGGVTN